MEAEIIFDRVVPEHGAPVMLAALWVGEVCLGETYWYPHFAASTHHMLERLAAFAVGYDCEPPWGEELTLWPLLAERQPLTAYRRPRRKAVPREVRGHCSICARPLRGRSRFGWVRAELCGRHRTELVRWMAAQPLLVERWPLDESQAARIIDTYKRWQEGELTIFCPCPICHDTSYRARLKLEHALRRGQRPVSRVPCHTCGDYGVIVNKGEGPLR